MRRGTRNNNKLEYRRGIFSYGNKFYIIICNKLKKYGTVADLYSHKSTTVPFTLLSQIKLKNLL